MQLEYFLSLRIFQTIALFVFLMAFAESIVMLFTVLQLLNFKNIVLGLWQVSNSFM